MIPKVGSIVAKEDGRRLQTIFRACKCVDYHVTAHEVRAFEPAIEATVCWLCGTVKSVVRLG
jgi:hypothetical protein